MRIIPYVVPSSYPINRASAKNLGHDTWAILAEYAGGVVTPVSPVSVEQGAWSRASENIDDIFTEHVKAQAFLEPEDGLPPFILCGGHDLAASCVLMPRLHQWASRVLNETSLLVSIPRAAAMLVFPLGTAAERKAMRAQIRDAETGEPKPITWGLFILDPSGLTAFHEP